MKHRRHQGGFFIFIGLAFWAAIIYMAQTRIMDLFGWVLLGIVGFCGVVNVVIGAVLIQKGEK